MRTIEMLPDLTFKLLLSVLVALLLWAPLTVSAQAATHRGRAVWVWNGVRLFQSDSLEAFTRFARAPHGDPDKRLELVFLSMRGGFVRADWPAIERVVGHLQDEGMTVHALTGDPGWVLRHDTPLLRLQQVIEYNEWAKPRARVAGIQFDIEPYLMRETWNSADGFQAIKAGFIDLLEQLGARRDLADPDLQIGVAIPRWYDQANYEFLNRDIQARSDYVAIMNYWNEARRLIRDATGELETADRLGTTVYVGVEVQEIDPPTITFYGSTVREMEAVLAEAEAAFARYDSYKGTVIHHYDPYAQMPAE